MSISADSYFVNWHALCPESGSLWLVVEAAESDAEAFKCPSIVVNLLRSAIIWCATTPHKNWDAFGETGKGGLIYGLRFAGEKTDLLTLQNFVVLIAANVAAFVYAIV